MSLRYTESEDILQESIQQHNSELTSFQGLSAECTGRYPFYAPPEQP